MVPVGVVLTSSLRVLSANHAIFPFNREVFSAAALLLPHSMRGCAFLGPMRAAEAAKNALSRRPPRLRASPFPASRRPSPPDHPPPQLPPLCTNENFGARINLRVRRASDRSQLLEYEDDLGTMLHS